MKKYFLWFIGVVVFSCAKADDTLCVRQFRHVGPIALQRPMMVDTVDFEGKSFDLASLLETPINMKQASEGALYEGDLYPSSSTDGLHLLAFNLTARAYMKAKLEVKNLKHYQIFVDGQKSGADLTLEPRSHQVVVKYLSAPSAHDSLLIKVTTDRAGALASGTESRHLYTLSDVTDGRRLTGIRLSSDGQYLITAHTTTFPGGRTQTLYQLKEVKTNRQLLETTENIQWFGQTSRYYITRQGEGGRMLVTTDVRTGEQEIAAQGLPEGYFYVSPKGDYLLYVLQNEGPKRDAQVYEIVEPDDRQPGWRNRSRLAKYDLKTGLLQPLTYGYHSVSLQDISQDGRYLLLMTSRSRLTQRPTTLSSLLRLDLQTMQADTLIRDDGFISSAQFSPDHRQVVVVGSPESLGGIGKNLPEGRIPSMYDYQLYLVSDVEKTGRGTLNEGRNARETRVLTRDFNPSVSRVWWNGNDGLIYFTANDLDFVSLFRCNPKDGKITKIDVPEDLVNSVSMADGAPWLAFYGESVSSSDRLYAMNTKTLKTALLEDTNDELLKDVELGECKVWNFVSSRGDTIYGRYYLPPHFDATKRYPMIVNYYGGCSPTSRNFESRYPQHAYAAQGYVVYVVNPSGAAGFGQEFSSRHVNTAGEGVADDIIEGVKRFCEEHPYVDAGKIGCIGASYGGFMTQYLQTKTDIFAAAVSHAGISDHTSYWGEGYWGYSYSEVSMAESYPWTRKDLYVDRSPLFNADRIHTPLLFLHGSSDTNVPVGESIQMYNALRLLGRPTAFVVVEGENHWVMDYQKRIKWQNTIFAWFARYLKDDPAWWNAMYPEKNL
ncbi:MAG: S9 family peptidase [Prevotella sp.]|nr:S9 family peptidase [Prevotella sp.]